MTTLLSRFLRKSESKNIKVGAKSAPMYALQVKPMLERFAIEELKGVSMQYLILTQDKGTINWNSNAVLLKEEAAHVWELYKESKIRSIWFTEQKDAILIVEANTREEAKITIETLPLVKANLTTYTIHTLLPYTGLERILNGAN